MKKTMDLLKNMLVFFFGDKEEDAILNLCSRDIHVCGLASDLVIDGIAMAQEYLNNRKHQEYRQYRISFFYEKEFSNHVAEVGFMLSHQNISMKYRVTAASIEMDNERKLSTLHFSVISPEHKPTMFQDIQKSRNIFNRQQLMDESIAGGMMGGYLEPGFPFYFVNQRMLAYLGYASEKEFIETIQGLIENCMYPEDRETVNCEVEKQIATANEYVVEYRMLKKDGSYIWVHDIGRVIKAEDGRDAITSICFDITREHLLQEELKKSNLEFENLMNNMPGGMAVYQWTGSKLKPLSVSRGFSELHGTDASALLDSVDNLNFGQVHPDDLPVLQKFIAESIKTPNQRKMIQYRIWNCRLEQYIWLQNSCIGILQEDGTQLIYSIYVDVTNEMELKQKSMEQEKQQQARMDLERKKMLSGDKMLTAYSIMNMTTLEIVECKDYQWTTGIAAGDMLDVALDKAADAIYLKEDAKRFRQNHSVDWVYANYQKGITSWEGDYRFANANGDMYWQRNVTNILKDPNTGDLYMYDYLYDIMAEKIMEEFVEGAVKSEFSIIGVLAMDSNKLYELNFDEGAARVIEKDYETLRYQYVEEYVLSEDQESVMHRNTIKNIREQLSLHPSGYAFEHRTLKADGTIAYNEVCYYKLRNSDNICFCNVRDITETIRKETKKQEELTKALNAAETATKAKTDFLARMSHDMRTPMNAIIGLSALTLDDAKNPVAVRENMSKMRASSDFLLGLVNDILDMAKIEDGSVILKPEPYTYAEFLANMKTMFQPQCDAKGITLKFKEPQINPMVRVDKMRINQIFFNIFSNALKFTPMGGTITYTVENLVFYDDKLTVDYVISDTGIGMSEEYQKHLFEPFVQESNNVTSELQGSGLGLSITKQLVDLMNGKIQITSQQGVGTTVRISFVMECVERDHKEMPKQSGTDMDDTVLKGKHILLVEDHPLNAQIAMKILEKKHIIVTHAENGRIAVEMFQSSKPGELDAILMDIRMPEMSGLDAARAIRALERADAKTVPIIAMSANAYAEDVQKSLDAGMNAHLAKPVDPQKLYQTLSETIITGREALM